MHGQEQAAHLLLSLFPGVMRAIASGLRGYEPWVSPAHLRLLLNLAQRSYNLSELAAEQEVSLPTMSNSVTTLAERGWVTRERAPRDRRMLLIAITPAGRAILAQIVQQAERCLAERMAALDPQELARVTDGLKVMQAAFQAGDETCWPVPSTESTPISPKPCI